MTIKMMGRGADLDIEDILRRQKLAQELYVGSLEPKQPERSWTQGAARLAQAISGAYMNSKTKDQIAEYNKNRGAGVQALAGALQGNGDIASTISQLPPELQGAALGLIQQRMKQQNDLQAKQTERQFELEKIDYGNQSKSNFDPIKKTQNDIYKYQQVLTDPNTPPEIKQQAQARMAQLQSSMQAMSPSRTTVNVDTGQKGEEAFATAYNKKKGEETYDNESKNMEAGQKADRNIYALNTIQKYIENGSLNNLNTSNFGQGLQTMFARMNLPNDMASIGQYILDANQQLVDARQQFRGQGQVSDNETKLLAGTVLQPNDTIEAAAPKLYFFKQVEERKQRLAQLTNEWVKKYGSTAKPAENGMSFYDAATKLYAKYPFFDYMEAAKQKQNQASQAAGVAQ
jgi:hypothetical protein